MKLTLVWPCALLCILSPNARASAQVAGVEQAIVGGAPVVGDAARALAVFSQCDGTLIAPGVVVTAAHCVPQIEDSDVQIGDAHVQLARCVAHPLFRELEGYDIAVCELAHDVQVEPASVELACRADSQTALGDLTLIGNGDLAAKVASNGVYSVTVPIEETRADGRELIVGDREHGACNGDSGGGVYASSPEGSRELVAVVSRRGPSSDGKLGENCASTTMLTLLQPQLAWIHQTANLDPSACPAARPPSNGCSLGGRDPSLTATLVLLAWALARRTRS